MPVGLTRQGLHPLAADPSPGPLQMIGGPLGTENANRLDQGLVLGIGVVAFKRTGLVHDLMGCKTRRSVVQDRRCWPLPSASHAPSRPEWMACGPCRRLGF